MSCAITARLRSVAPWLLRLTTIVLTIGAGAPARAGTTASSYARRDLHALGPARLAVLRADPVIEWWVELDDVLLVGGEERGLAALVRTRGGDVVAATPGTELRIVGGVQPAQLAAIGARPLATGGRWVVAEMPSSVEHVLVASSGNGHAIVRSFTPNVVLARQAANAPRRPSALPSTMAAPPVDQVNAARWFADVATLAGWNRYTHGSGIASARAWLVSQFQALPGAIVTTQAFQVSGTTAYNVIARIPGTTKADDWFLVGGHYDSTSQSPSTAAPGAEDNATGCSAVLEMARIFTAQPQKQTLLFMCYAGEEQGLYGSIAHASSLVSSGDAAKVRAVLAMDMVGYNGDSDPDCMLETLPEYEWLSDLYTDAATAYTSLRMVINFTPERSDHVPYLDRGMATVLTAANDWDVYPHYHRTTDTPDKIGGTAMGEQILRMNVASLAALLSAECTDADGDGYGNPASVACAHPEADCNDANAAVHPGATEVTNGVDDDCDGQIDERSGCGGVARTADGADPSAVALTFVFGVALAGVVRRLRPTHAGLPRKSTTRRS